MVILRAGMLEDFQSLAFEFFSVFECCVYLVCL